MVFLAAVAARIVPGLRGDSRVRAPLTLAVCVATTLALAVLQPLIWYAGIASRGGFDHYIRYVTDFTPALTGAVLVREGNGTHLYDIQAQRLAQAQVAPPVGGGSRETVNIYNHPPAEALVLALALALPYSLCFALWTTVSIAAFGFALWLLAAALHLEARARLLLIAVGCAYLPFHMGLWLGQNSSLVFLGLCGIYWAWTRNRDGWLGVALVIFGLKPQLLPLVVLFLILQKCWRALAIAASSVAVMSVAVMPILGIGWPLKYARYLLSVSNSGAAVFENPGRMHNWRGLLLNVFGDSHPAVVSVLLVALSLATIGALLWISWRARHTSIPPNLVGLRGEGLFVTTCAAMILVAPHLHVHDMIMLIVPAAIVGARVAGDDWGQPTWAWVTLLFLGWAVPFLTLVPQMTDRLSVPLSVATLVGLILLMLRNVTQGNEERRAVRGL